MLFFIFFLADDSESWFQGCVEGKVKVTSVAITTAATVAECAATCTAAR